MREGKHHSFGRLGHDSTTALGSMDSGCRLVRRLFDGCVCRRWTYTATLGIGLSQDDALCSLEGYNAETDPRHVRRELAPEEAAWLLATTGTDNATPISTDVVRTSDDSEGQWNRQCADGSESQNVANGGESNASSMNKLDNPKILTLSRNDNRQPPSADAGERGAARIRTGDGGFAIHCLSRLATAPR
jgi:hypothetical protein